MDWLTAYKIPIGAWAKVIFDWMKTHLGPLFDAISWVMEGMIAGILWILQTPHPLVVVAAFVAITWALQRNWKICLGVLLGFLFVMNQGYWKETTESLTLILSACVVCMAAGVPLGILFAHRPRLYTAISPVLDLMQTLPTFVYLIPVLTLFGLGNAPGLIVTIIFVIPTSVRLTHLGVTSVPKSIVEAGEAFGATKRQLLWKVELPSALPTIMAGLTQSIMLSLSMVVFAALIGAGGLGTEINRALGSRKIDLGLEAGLAIVVLAIVLDRMTRIGVGGKK